MGISSQKTVIKYNPNIHRRRSIRLKGYDYSQTGLYFISICCQNKASLFGEIKDGQMTWNEAGMMVQTWYHALPGKFNDIICHEMIVMPNHFHCIIQNTGIATNVGADPRVCPNLDYNDDDQNDDDQTPILKTSGQTRGSAPTNTNTRVGLGEHMGSPLFQVVQWFKTMTTNEYIRGVKNKDWPPFNGRLWQRNYYEHSIRNEQSYKRIAEYIIHNPAKWAEDMFYNE